MLVEGKTKVKYVNVITNNGDQYQYAIKSFVSDIVNLGYRHFVFISDQEPLTLSLKEAVHRRTTAVEGAGAQMIPEVPPIGESQSNREVPSAVKQVQGQFRTIRSQLQAIYKKVMAEDSEILL